MSTTRAAPSASRERKVDLAARHVDARDLNGNATAEAPRLAGLLPRERHARLVVAKPLVTERAHGNEALGARLVEHHEHAKASAARDDARVALPHAA